MDADNTGRDADRIALDHIDARIDGIIDLHATLISVDVGDDTCAAVADVDARRLAAAVIDAWVDLHELVGSHAEAVVSHVAEHAAIEARADRYKLAQSAREDDA